MNQLTYGFITYQHLIHQSIAMTNNEILQANLLDILFEGRNKEYGAYALRRDYNHRLLMAIGIGASVILVFIFISVLKKSGNDSPGHPTVNGTIQLTAIQLPEDLKPLERLRPRAAQQPVVTIKYTTPVLVEDIPHTEVPDIETIDNNAISDQTKEGPAYMQNDAPVQPGETNNTATGTIAETLPSSAPEFPGGFDALREFLSRNLLTPDNLEVGEKKIVRARFIVDKDGSVSAIEIEVSAGKIFDKEVIRVCKKMPKWKPAVQNGHPITVSYILPVTFIGVELKNVIICPS